MKLSSAQKQSAAWALTLASVLGIVIGGCVALYQHANAAPANYAMTDLDGIRWNWEPTTNQLITEMPDSESCISLTKRHLGAKCVLTKSGRFYVLRKPMRQSIV